MANDFEIATSCAVGSFLLYQTALGVLGVFRYLRWKYSRSTFHF